jgi:hypothetical protein
MILRILVCIFFFGFTLASYVEKQNQVTAFKLRIPQIAKEIKLLHEDNARLVYEIEQFESPENLLYLAQKKEFSHLKHPLISEIFTLKEAIALKSDPAPTETTSDAKLKINIAIGTR